MLITANSPKVGPQKVDHQLPHYVAQQLMVAL